MSDEENMDVAQVVKRLKWLPIETAPKSEEHFLAFANGHCYECFWFCQGYWIDYYGEQPTHWMPLPAPPQR